MIVQPKITAIKEINSDLGWFGQPKKQVVTSQTIGHLVSRDDPAIGRMRVPEGNP